MVVSWRKWSLAGGNGRQSEIEGFIRIMGVTTCRGAHSINTIPGHKDSMLQSIPILHSGRGLKYSIIWSVAKFNLKSSLFSHFNIHFMQSTTCLRNIRYKLLNVYIYPLCQQATDEAMIDDTHTENHEYKLWPTLSYIELTLGCKPDGYHHRELQTNF